VGAAQGKAPAGHVDNGNSALSSGLVAFERTVLSLIQESNASVTVVVISDHVVSGHHSSSDLRRAIMALTQQEIEEPFDILVGESQHFEHCLEPDLRDLDPRCRIGIFPQYASFAVKNAAVASAQTEFVALLDADCVPKRDWLRRMLAAIRSDPKIAIVSGPTFYPGDSFVIRACSLLDRAGPHPGKPGPTQFIAINNAIYRRQAYLENPLPDGIGSFCAQIQEYGLARNGWKLFFDPAVEVTHDYDGWSMEADFRRNRGYGTIRTRLEDSSLPYAWLARSGRLSIPVILAGKLIDSWRDCLRCGAHYGFRGPAILGAMLLSLPLHWMEIPGMLQAYRRMKLEDSAFR